MSTPISASLSIQPINKQGIFKATLTLIKTSQTVVQASHESVVIFVLDQSGSMSGVYERQLIPIVIQATEALKDQMGPLHYIAFNKGARRLTFDAFKQSVAGGGTSFSAALGELRSLIQDIISKRPQGSIPCFFQVIFLTDGEDCGAKDYFDKLVELNQLSSTMNFEFAVHALGIGSYDVSFLGELVLKGSRPGTFQGKERGANFSLSEAVDGIVALVSEEALTTPVVITDLAVPLQLVNLSQVASSSSSSSSAASAVDQAVHVEARWNQELSTTSIFLQAPATESLDALVAALNESHAQLSFADGSLPAVAVNVSVLPPSDDVIQSQLTWLQYQCEAVAKLILSDASSLAQAGTVLTSLRAQVQEMNVQIAQSRNRELRRAKYEQVQNLNKSVAAAQTAYSDALVGKLDGSDRARLLNQAYGSRLADARSRLVRQLDKRAEANILRSEQAESALNDLAQKKRVVFEQLNAAAPEQHLSRSIFYDYVRAGDLFEMLSEGPEAFGVTVELVDPPSADNPCMISLASPALLAIKHVNQSCMTLESFMESTEFEVVRNQREAQANESLIQGLPHENVHGIIPLFVHDLHWSVAKLQLAKPLSQMSTGNPLAYTTEMIRTIPFTALVTSVCDLYLNANPSERSMVLFWALFRTGAQIAYEHRFIDYKKLASANSSSQSTAATSSEVEDAMDTSSPSAPVTAPIEAASSSSSSSTASSQYECKFSNLLTGFSEANSNLWGPDVLPSLDMLYGSWISTCSLGAHDADFAKLYVQALSEEVRRFIAISNIADDQIQQSVSQILGAPAVDASKITENLVSKATQAFEQAAASSSESSFSVSTAAVDNGSELDSLANETIQSLNDFESYAHGLLCPKQSRQNVLSARLHRLCVIRSAVDLIQAAQKLYGSRKQLLQALDDNYGVAPSALLELTRSHLAQASALTRTQFAAVDNYNNSIVILNDLQTQAHISNISPVNHLRAILLNAVTYKSNASRRAAVDSHTYVDAGLKPVQVLTSFVSDAYHKQHNTARLSAATELFVSSDVKVAAGLLLKDFGATRFNTPFHNLLEYFVSADKLNSVADALAKLQMFVEGSYQGVAVLDHGDRWKPSRENARRAYRAFAAVGIPLSDADRDRLLVNYHNKKRKSACHRASSERYMKHARIGK